MARSALRQPPLKRQVEPRARARPGWRAVAAGAALLTLWGALALALHRRNAAWTTRLALWEASVAEAPDKARVRLSLGFALREQRRYPEAIAHYRSGLRSARGDVQMELQLLRNMGAALIWSGRLDDALSTLRQALAKAPDEPDILTNLAVTQLGRRELAAAEEYARRAVQSSAGQGDAWNVLGAVLVERGDLSGAQQALERAVSLDPDAAVRAFNLGRVYAAQGRIADACGAWRKAAVLRMDPGLRAQVERHRAERNCP
jgi:Flp pilus assembly protein TadD